MWTFHYISEQLYRAQKETRVQTIGVTIRYPDLPFNDITNLGCGGGRGNSFHNIKTSEGTFRYEELRPSINPPARSPDARMQVVALLGLARSPLPCARALTSAWLHGRRKSGLRGVRNLTSFEGSWTWILNSSFSLELESFILVGPQVPYLKIEEIITCGTGFLYDLVIVAKNRWSLNGTDGFAGGGGGGSNCYWSPSRWSKLISLYVVLCKDKR